LTLAERQAQGSDRRDRSRGCRRVGVVRALRARNAGRAPTATQQISLRIRAIARNLQNLLWCWIVSEAVNRSPNVVA